MIHFFIELINCYLADVSHTYILAGQSNFSVVSYQEIKMA